MASPSNVNTSSPSEKYPYPTEFNVLDFVPKLLSERNYNNWKLLMRDFIRMRGLIGFIEGAAAEERGRDEAWERSNNLVRGWILATLSKDIRPRVLRSKSAKGLWTRLEEIFDPTRSTWQPDEGMEYRQGHYLALQKAAINGDWDKAREIIEREPDAVRTHITPTLQTALAIAISSGSAGRNRFVRELLEKMTPQDLVVVVDNHGRTALFEAVWIDNMEGAKMLVNRNPDLPNVWDKFGDTPLHWAAMCGFREMYCYSFKVRYCLLKKKMIFTVPHVKRIREKKERQHNALELVKFLCMEVVELDLSKVERIFKPALRNAARVGIPEIVKEIVLSYPSALFFMDLGGLDIFKYAILYRRERVFNLIYQTDHAGKRFIFAEDFSLINGLHLVARLRHEQQINLKSSAAGAVLQMQREVQWFKVSLPLLHHVK
ncbi:hypothetical protein RHSIM_Rhsim03G0044400 [Rhododendron simsii]|uniref:Ankyrin repeat family protein n=1 Tax=Rhododendron simsii TaxID=118357 RepID=A0A834H4H4_RHOSS|nr:hypothetical protein RHSIM_Rhsim03G0044400 [Rhododendron simsii]